MSQIWFTSDLHLGHNKPFLYEPRGFTNIYDHDDAIISHINNTVSHDDELYILGDLMLGDNEAGIRKIKQIKCPIHIIRGNHDSDARMELYDKCYNVIEICEGKFFKYGKYHFYLSHFPCIVSNYDEDKSLKQRMISLAGHSHYKDKFADIDKGLIYHIELDAHNNYPVSIDEIINDIKNYKRRIFNENPE